MTAIVQMLGLDQRMAPVEVKITSENPSLTTSREIIIAASKKFKTVTKSCRAYNGLTRLELVGDVSLDELSQAHVVLSSKAGWKGAIDPSENANLEPNLTELTADTEKLEAELSSSLLCLEKLRNAANSDRSNGVVLLWKDTQDNGYLSNWARSPIVLDHVAYNCVEQWIMASKARACGDSSVREQIMQASSPKKQKALGRSLDKKAVDRCWKVQQKWTVQLRGVRAKFQQNDELACRLLQTGQKPIAEASPSDQVFGIGLAPSNPLAQDPANWKGLNLLGKALMQVRGELRSHILSGGDLRSFDISPKDALADDETSNLNMSDVYMELEDPGALSESSEELTEEPTTP